MSYSTVNGSIANWGSIRLEGDDDLTMGGSYMRNLGMGIEGRPLTTASGGIESTPPTQTSQPTLKPSKRSSGISWTSGKATALIPVGQHPHASSSTAFGSSYTEPSDDPARELAERRDQQIMTTLALLRTFHANTCFQLSRLRAIITQRRDSGTTSDGTVYLTPKDILSLELGPLSGFDAKYLGWLAAEYTPDTRVVVKRSWRDLLAMIFGYG
jgi:hypothetical protein